jgi:hypothetical protein
MLRHSSRLLATLLAASLFAGTTSSARAEEKAKPKAVKAAQKKDHDHNHDSKDKKTDKKKSDHGHSHHHEAPNGGTLIALGDHFAHLELVLDKATGKLTGYVLDGEAEKALRIKQDGISIEARLGEGASATSQSLTLNAVDNVLTGEKVGDTSQFEGTFGSLKGVERFQAKVKELTLKGKTLRDVEFKFPEGNEEGH